MNINGIKKGILVVMAGLVLSGSANATGFSKFLAALRLSPIKDLQQQTADLQAQIDALKIALEGAQNNGPVVLDVDCNAGGSVNAALASTDPSASQVTVNIVGTCHEQVALLRDNVTLIGLSSDATIAGTNFGVIATRGADNLSVTDLTLTGAIAGLGVINNASVEAARLNLIDSPRGALVIFGGFLALTDSTVSGNVQGLTVVDGSNVRLLGTSVLGNTIGVNVFANGSITLDDNDALVPSVISGSTADGVRAFGNGTVRLSSVIIENNGGSGVSASTGGSIVSDLVINVIIRGNRNGITLSELGSYGQSLNTSIVDNIQFGVSCTGTVGLTPRLALPGVSGNGIANYSPECGNLPVVSVPSPTP